MNFRMDASVKSRPIHDLSMKERLKLYSREVKGQPINPS